MRVFNSWGHPGRSLPPCGLLSLLLLLGLATGAQAQIQCTTANSDGSYNVPTDWPLKPSGLAVGTKFRLLFLTSTRDNADSTDIDDYNSFVQTRARAGHAAITDSCGNRFKVVGSTASVNARANTDSESTDTDAAIYWLNGAKVADNYADFYDNSWDSRTAKDESGGTISTNPNTWTGTDTDGTAHSSPLGSSNPRIGTLAVNITSPLNQTGSSNTNLGRFYALSPVLTVAPTVQFAADKLTYPEAPGTGSTPVLQTGVTILDVSGTITSGQLRLTGTDGTAVRGTHYNLDRGGSMLISDLGAYAIYSLGSSTSSNTGVFTYPNANDEPDKTFTWTLAKNITNDRSFSLGSRTTATVVIRDNDPTIVTLSRVGTGGITEGGAAAEFTVSLGRALVTGEIIDVPLVVSGTSVTASDWSLARKSGGSLNTGVTLRTGNVVRFSGAGAQTATLELTAASDSANEGTETFTVALGTNTQFDALTGTNVGGGADPSTTTNSFNVAVSNVTPAGVTISKSSVSVAEAGGIDTYTVVLDTQPSHSVTITPTSGTATAATVSGALTFSTSNWNTAQTVTVTGVNDDVDQSSNRSSTITHAATSTDTNYSGIGISSVTATVVDDDGVGVTISKSSVSVAEAGGTDTYTVVLDSEPSHNVTITPTSGTTSAATVSPTSLTFTTAIWNTAQTVTVTGVDDTVDQSVDRSATISHSASSSDTSYNSIGISSVTATVVDDDTSSGSDDGDTSGSKGLTFSPSELPVTEGGSSTYTVKLSTEPTGDVTVTIASDNSDVTVDTDSTRLGNQTTLSFTPSNWSQAQSVTVSAVQDADTSDDSAMLTHTASGGGYGSVSGTVNVNVRDDDDPGLELSLPGAESSLSVSEGRSTSYTMALATEPTGDVTVMVSISGGEGSGLTIAPTRLVFTPSNWSEEQRVTVTAAENAATGRTVTLNHSASGGGYDGIPLSDVEVRVVSANPAAAVGGWQLRFGRTVSQQVVDALQQRWSTNPTAGHLTVAGETISSTTPPLPLAENEGVLSKALGFDPLTLQQMVEDSSFTIAPQPQPEIETEPEAEGGAPQLAVWGQGALSSFTGEGNGLSSLRGDVTTLLLGADWSTTRWQAGAALSHSWGNGSYAADGRTDGDMSSTLTGLFPYGRYGLTPRLAIWAVAGYGWGHLSLQSDGGDGDYKPSTTMGMAALGMDGLLLDGGKEGISLTSTAELLTLKSTTAEVEGLESSEGSVSRLRLGLEATRAFPLSNGASLLPTMAVGLRQDSGNAETGFGMDVGAGMVWNDPERGIRGEVKGRTLLTHREKSFQEQGMAISFSWDPTPSKRGPSLSLSHTVGATASGGMDALLNPTTMEDASPSRGGQQEFAAEVAYGFPAHRDRLTLTPAVALALSSTSRNYGLLWSLAPYAEQSPQTPPWEVALEGERQEQDSPTPAVHHSLKLTFSSLF